MNAVIILLELQLYQYIFLFLHYQWVWCLRSHWFIQMISTGSSPLMRHTTSCHRKEIKGVRPSFGGSILRALVPGTGLWQHRITSQVCMHKTLLVRFCHLCTYLRQSPRSRRTSILIPRCVMVCQWCLECLDRTRCAATPPRLLFRKKGSMDTSL